MEAEEELRKALMDANIVFVTAGMGGGTGTGSAAVVAKIAKDMGALTIAVTTTPLQGRGQDAHGERGVGTGTPCGTPPTPSSSSPTTSCCELYPRLSLNAAFKVADEVLTRAIKGITELITKPGLVNLDFNDVKTIMKGAGVAMIGLGESDGQREDRAMEAIEDALNSPLLEVDICGATGVLVNVIGGPDMTISDAQKVAEEVHKRISPTAQDHLGCGRRPHPGAQDQGHGRHGRRAVHPDIGQVRQSAKKLKGADLDFIK